MKSKFIKVAFMAAIALVSGVNVFNAQKSETLSDVAMANVEALANGEYTVEDCLGNSEYSYLAIARGTLQEFFHIDGGRDRVNIYEVERCVAEGYGTLSGSNGILSKWFLKNDEVDCTGLCQRNQW